MTALRLCACGCGQLAQGEYKRTHRPIKHYPVRHGVRLHRWLAEQARGKPLPPGAVVHHHNGKKVGGALVVCQNAAYHVLIHTRTKIFYAGGDPNTDGWCYACKQPRPRTLFSKGRIICRPCQSERYKAWWARVRQEN